MQLQLEFWYFSLEYQLLSKFPFSRKVKPGCFLKRFLLAEYMYFLLAFQQSFSKHFDFFINQKVLCFFVGSVQTNIFYKAFNVWCFSIHVYDYSLCLQLAEINLQFLSLMNTLRECNSSVLVKPYPMCTSILFTYTHR